VPRHYAKWTRKRVSICDSTRLLLLPRQRWRRTARGRPVPARLATADQGDEAERGCCGGAAADHTPGGHSPARDRARPRGHAQRLGLAPAWLSAAASPTNKGEQRAARPQRRLGGTTRRPEQGEVAFVALSSSRDRERDEGERWAEAENERARRRRSAFSFLRA
jgi:hypothetical protein